MTPESKRDFDRIARREFCALRTRALRLERTADAADDLLQDTFERALKHFSRDKAPYARAWLSSIMTHLFLDRRRRRQRRGQQCPAEPDGLALPPPDEAPPRWVELTALQVQRAIAELDLPFRCVVTRRCCQGESQRDVAAALSLSPSTVATRLHRARVKLRGLLERQLEIADRESARRCARGR